MMQNKLTTATLLLIAIVFSSCSQQDAEFEKAKRECGKVAIDAAMLLPGTFDREHEAMMVKIAKECLNKRGYDVELKPE